MKGRTDCPVRIVGIRLSEIRLGSSILSYLAYLKEGKAVMVKGVWH